MKLLPNSNISRDVLRIALPVVGGLSTQMLLSLVDTAMVGRLANSKVALAALGVTFLASWAITSLFSSISTGTHVLIARRHGEENKIEAGVVLNNSLALALMFGIIVGALGYFFSFEIVDVFAKDAAVSREGTDFMAYKFLGLPFFLLIVSYRSFFYGIGHTKVFLVSAFIVMVVHIFFNIALVFGNFGFPAMGLAGAGAASFISMIAGAVFFIAVTFLKEYRITYSLFRKPKLSKNIIQQILKISIPVSLQNVMILLGFLIFVSVTGIIGTGEQAASQVVISALFISLTVVFGLGAAAQTLVGQSLGRDNPSRAQMYGFETAKICTFYTISIGLIFILLPDLVLKIITNNKELCDIGRPLLQVAGLAQILYGAGIILAYSLQSAGATVYVMTVEIITHWIIFLPLSYVYGVALGGGILGAWWALPVYTVPFLLLNYFKFKSKTWMSLKI
jgi:multidrug resistance protein, MATE family